MICKFCKRPIEKDSPIVTVETRVSLYGPPTAPGAQLSAVRIGTDSEGDEVAHLECAERDPTLTATVGRLKSDLANDTTLRRITERL